MTRADFEIENDVSDIIKDVERNLKEMPPQEAEARQNPSPSADALERFRREYMRRVVINTAARA